MFNWFRKAKESIQDSVDPLVGRRFCKVEMNGCMATDRGNERFGTIVSTQIGNSDCYNENFSDLSDIMKRRARRTGKYKWALIKYDDGSENLEPAWWFHDTGEHIEYCI